jgi:hypothetical protein
MKSPFLAVAWLAVMTSVGVAAPAADGVPKLDVAQSCREAQAFGGDDKNLAYKGCMQDEKEARELLAKKWSGFKPADRRDCVAQGRAPMPSYVEILTCLEMYDGSSSFNKPLGDSHRTLGEPAPVAAPPPASTTPAPAGGGETKF